LLFALAEAELKGGVAVLVDGALADDGARTNGDCGDAADLATFVEDLRIAELFADEAEILVHVLCSVRVRAGSVAESAEVRQRDRSGSGRRCARGLTRAGRIRPRGP